MQRKAQDLYLSLQTRTGHGGGERVKKKKDKQCTLLTEEEGLMHNTDWADAAAGTRDQMTAEIGLS